MENLRRIDLSPLSHCPELEYTLFSQMGLLKIDITPLLNLKKLRDFYINDETKIYAKRSALQGDLPDALNDWYAEEIVWK